MIEVALTADPTNTELLQLQSDLNTLITLTKQSLGTPSSNNKVKSNCLTITYQINSSY